MKNSLVVLAQVFLKAIMVHYFFHESIKSIFKGKFDNGTFKVPAKVFSFKDFFEYSLHTDVFVGCLLQSKNWTALVSFLFELQELGSIGSLSFIKFLLGCCSFYDLQSQIEVMILVKQNQEVE